MNYMKDVVCGMEITDSKFKSSYKGKEYTFCSENCKITFDKNPEKFAK